MGKPGVPAYGREFRWEPVPYEHPYAGRRYVLKADGSWYIRSEAGGRSWHLFRGQVRAGGPYPTMRAAMAECILQAKYYALAAAPEQPYGAYGRMDA
jgi:hypothetical protein